MILTIAIHPRKNSKQMSMVLALALHVSCRGVGDVQRYRHRLHDVLQFCQTLIKNCILKNWTLKKLLSKKHDVLYDVLPTTQVP